MNWILSALQSSIWIDSLIAVCAIGVRMLLISPRARYGVLYTSLVLMLAAPALYAALASPDSVAVSGGPHGVRYVILWVIGAVLASCRLLFSAASLRALLRSSVPYRADRCLAQVREMAAALGVRRIPELRIVDCEVAPCTIGVFKAVILIPASVLAHLSPEQLQAILAHELGHIRRWDYWANIAQMIVESLLFFHPAVWLVSHLVRIDREICCDDIALELVNDRPSYARALSKVAHLGAGSMVPSATGGGLQFRIRRLLGLSLRPPISAPRSLPMSCVLCAVLAVGLFGFSGTKWSVSFPASQLPEKWSARAFARTDADLVEIRLHTPGGENRIVLTRPTVSEKVTGFSIIDGAEKVKFEGLRDPEGNVAFRRISPDG